MDISITLLLIIVTCIVSFISFSNQDLLNKLIFYPPAVTDQKQWYRFITSGFIHADMPHLIFNMYALYVFGGGDGGVESQFMVIFGTSGRLLYLVMYLLALVACLVPTYEKNKNNSYYRSLGASGAVSAVVFASILFRPLGYMGLVFIPVYLVSFLFGLLYLGVSYWLDKKGGGNINHSAHIWGALFGLLFVFLTSHFIANHPILSLFLENLRNFDLSKIVITR